MVNWAEMLRHAEDWATGFWAGAATASLMGSLGLRSCCSFAPYEAA